MVASPTIGSPMIGGPTIGSPTIGLPTIGRPTIGGPTIGGPTIGGPTIGGPTIGGPTIGGPTIGGPTIGGPTIGGPTIGGPTIGGPTMSGWVSDNYRTSMPPLPGTGSPRMPTISAGVPFDDSTTLTSMTKSYDTEGLPTHYYHPGAPHPPQREPSPLIGSEKSVGGNCYYRMADRYQTNTPSKYPKTSTQHTNDILSNHPQHTLSIQPSFLLSAPFPPLTSPQQHTQHPLNTPCQHTLSTQPGHPWSGCRRQLLTPLPPSQFTLHTLTILSIQPYHPLNTPSTHPVNTARTSLVRMSTTAARL